MEKQLQVWALRSLGLGQQQVFQQQVFIYSRPITGIRAKMEHETTYLQTSKWHVKNIFMHLGLNITQISVRNIGETLKSIYFNRTCPGSPKEPSPRRRLL